jgi:two-component system, chemotaxis family, sensor histidine kinase and response regulator WspE
MSAPNLGDLSMLDLFRLDADAQLQALDEGLLALERGGAAASHFESCMRAAHSLKGAARVIGLAVGVEIAHAMEDCFVAAQRGTLALGRPQIDVLLQGVDLLKRIAGTPENEIPSWAGAQRPDVDGFLAALRETIACAKEPQPATPAPAEKSAPGRPEATAQQSAEHHAESPHSALGEETVDRVLHVTAEHLNRLLGLAGESLVESRRFKPFSESLLRLKRLQGAAAASIDAVRDALIDQQLPDSCESALADARQRIDHCRQLLAAHLAEVDLFDSRATRLAHGLYDSALACRMRPFAGGVRALPRMVRDVGRLLGKSVRLDIVGEGTQVDRDILEKLEAPLGHLLRNAVDHGIELPDLRLAAGKPAEGVVRLEARHSAGQLQIVVSDDGHGIDVERLRQKIVGRKLTSAETARKLSDAELLEFLFLPGFTLKEEITEISGRGVGLDVVQSMIKQVRGTIRVTSDAGRGMRFQMLLPLTLSVVRTLLVDIGGEPYAFPLASIVRTLKLPRDALETLEGRQHSRVDGRAVGLVGASQVFGAAAPSNTTEELSVVVLGEQANPYGLVVDRFLGERDLVVQPLDKCLGKVQDISAGALMEDGSPVLIVDVEDMLRSVEKFVAAGRLNRIARGAGDATSRMRHRVLVVDDSLTVRELERKLLDRAGYEVEIAVDGMDGWNAVRSGEFDLIVTDIDMPRMDGIELVRLIKQDPKLGKLPVMIVSYKDREEDRQRGLEAGADYYLTKSSFHDDTLERAVADLIGEAAA